MKRSLLILATTLGLLAQAVAADMPVKYTAQTQAVAAYNWQGLYVGLNGGYANSYEKTSVVGNDPIANVVLATGFLPSSLDTRHDGWTFGGQIGWNIAQIGNFLWGVEADIQFSDTKTTATQALTLSPLGIPIGLSGSASSERNWFGTARVRAGFLLTDRVFIYGTGGLAFADFDHSASATLTAPAPFGVSAAATKSGTEFGWTVGGGIEAVLAHGWRVKGEYLYSDFGDVSLTYGATVLGAPVSFTANTALQYHDVRVGLNYAF